MSCDWGSKSQQIQFPLLIKGILIDDLKIVTTSSDVDLNALGYNALRQKLVDLLWLFDSQDSDAALKVLSTLTSYKFDGYASQALRCIIIRKGQIIMPYLQQEFEREKSDCLSSIEAKPKICMEMDAWKAGRVREMLNAIQRGETCDDMP